MTYYSAAPLPFQGQKRRFVRLFQELVRAQPEGSIFVDLFGGSGLLSHIAKSTRPEATVVYNDFDDYSRRIANIPRTNALLERIRPLLHGVEPACRVPPAIAERIFALLEEEVLRSGFVDFITISSNLFFSGRYGISLEDFCAKSFYNNLRSSPYEAEGYLDGLTVTHADYRELIGAYAPDPRVIFIADPPYCGTDTTTYTMDWQLGDFLDVARNLHGLRYIYFTSSKSPVTPLFEWIGKNPGVGNPFAAARRMEKRVTVNKVAGYTDIMLDCSLSPAA